MFSSFTLLGVTQIHTNYYTVSVQCTTFILMHHIDESKFFTYIVNFCPCVICWWPHNTVYASTDVNGIWHCNSLICIWMFDAMMIHPYLSQFKHDSCFILSAYTYIFCTFICMIKLYNHYSVHVVLYMYHHVQWNLVIKRSDITKPSL